MAKTIYKKKVKNGKEYYFYRLRHENLLKSKDIYAKTVRELEEKIKKVKYELDNDINSTNVTFGEFLEDWLYEVKFLNLKDSTKINMNYTYKKYIENSSIYNIKLKSITAIQLQKYFNSLYKTCKPTVVKKVNDIIGPCIRYAYNNGYIIKDFSRMYVLPKDPEKNKTKEVYVFNREEEKIFLNAIKGHRLELLFITALYTGMRQGELLALTWEDIDFQNNTITVNKSLKRVADINKDSRSKIKVIVGNTKTGKSRIVPIPNFLGVKLKQAYKEDKENKLKLGANYNNLVFKNRSGNYLFSNAVNLEFKKILKENGLPNCLTFHSMRHSYATKLILDLEENAKTVQELLGHANINMTLNIYSHVLQNKKETAINKLDDLFNSL